MALPADSDLSAYEFTADRAALGRASASSGAKRGFDLVMALLILVFIAPLLLAVALLILVDSRGPVLFVQRRTGLGGRQIRVLKFRTMSVLEDGERVEAARYRDLRITRVGRFLRRSSIDELPQLINVLRGDMSLVGPRPHALAHDRYYAAALPMYGQRFRARPGITGLAQVKGLRGEVRSIDGMAERVAEDNAYIDNWSLALDVKILARTAVAVFQDGAY
jgi:putative colanic acid biosynthesis UDP-glucose lipid carrier transferase